MIHLIQTKQTKNDKTHIWYLSHVYNRAQNEIHNKWTVVTLTHAQEKDDTHTRNSYRKKNTQRTCKT